MTIEHLANTDFEKLSGKYQNIYDTIFGRIKHNPTNVSDKNIALTDRLFNFHPGKHLDNNSIIEFQFVSSRRAKVNYYHNDSLMFSKKLRGRIMNGYFYGRPKFLLIPFMPIFYWHNFQRVRISKIGDDLIVDHTLNFLGFVIIAGSSQRGRSTTIYKRAKT